MSEVQRKIVLELTKVPYSNPAKNYFCIIKGIIREVDEHGKPDAIGKTLTAKGSLPNPVVGAYYTLHGVAKWEKDFNEHQFMFSSHEVNQTATATGTQNYLVKECPGIGEGRARQLVGLFGAKTLEMLARRENIPFVSESIVGLDIKAATEICDWCEKESVLMPVKQKLYQAGMTQGLIKTLTANHGTNTEKVLREDCFSLTDIKGIGFLTADKIATTFGMPKTDPQRIKAGVLHALSDVMDDKGHTCVEHHILINAACDLLDVHKSHVIEAMKQMITGGELCTDKTDPRTISKIPELFKEDEPLPPPSQPIPVQPSQFVAVWTKAEPVPMAISSSEISSLLTTPEVLPLASLPTSLPAAIPVKAEDKLDSLGLPAQLVAVADSNTPQAALLQSSIANPSKLPAQPSKRNARRFSE